MLTGTSLLRSSLSKFLHSDVSRRIVCREWFCLKISSGIVFTLGGMATPERLMPASSNAPVEIVLTPFGIGTKPSHHEASISVLPRITRRSDTSLSLALLITRPIQRVPRNALSPTISREVGTLLKSSAPSTMLSLLPENALAPICVSVSGKTTSVSFRSSTKALSAMAVTVAPATESGIVSLPSAYSPS